MRARLCHPSVETPLRGSSGGDDVSAAPYRGETSRSLARPGAAIRRQLAIGFVITINFLLKPAQTPPVTRPTTAQSDPSRLRRGRDTNRPTSVGHSSIGRLSMSKRIALLSAVAFSALAVTASIV